MKNDPTYKFVAAAILAGVIAAIVSPARQIENAPAAPTAIHAATTATGLSE